MQKNRMIFFLIIAVAVLPLLVFSFLDKYRETNGGECKYDISAFPAKIISVEKADTGLFEVNFSVTMNGKTEILYYSREMGRYASGTDIKTFNLTEGNIFLYERHIRKSGNCDEPEFFVLKMEKYKEE